MNPEAIERMIDQGRDSYEARLAAGQARLKQGDLQRARTHLERACALAPDKTMAWQTLGQAHQALGDDSAARQAWTRGQQVARSNGDQQAEKVISVWLRRLERDESEIDPRAVFAAGRLLGLPTETVYGLAAPIDRPDLIEKVFRLKGRPASHPLIVHVADRDQAKTCVAEWPAAADALVERFWPGPLTLVLPRSPLIADVITAGQSTVAVRMPDHPAALSALRRAGVALVAPSANPFTGLSPTRAEHVSAAFPADQVTVIDGGPCRVGIESTIVALDSKGCRARILRPGMISAEQLAEALPGDWRLESAGNEGLRAPGQMREHYRPQRPLNVEVLNDEAALEQRRIELEQTPSVAVVLLSGKAEVAAQELYAALRAADRSGIATIHLLLLKARVEQPDWRAIINRLSKAASSWTAPAAP